MNSSWESEEGRDKVQGLEEGQKWLQSVLLEHIHWCSWSQKAKLMDGK